MAKSDVKKSKVVEGDNVKKAIITGITGQDGSYLAEFLLEKVTIVDTDRKQVLYFPASMSPTPREPCVLYAVLRIFLWITHATRREAKCKEKRFESPESHRTSNSYTPRGWLIS